MRTFLVSITLLGVLAFATKAISNSHSNNDVVLTADNTVIFAGEVDSTSVAKAQLELAKVSQNLSRNDTIFLVIDSPGGSVMAGNQFVDFAKNLPQKVKPICLFCASMGYHIFESLGERLVLPSSQLMSHRASLGGLSGQVPGELESRLNNIKSVLLAMDEAVAKRVGVSTAEYRASIYNELWLSGTEAVKTRHADRIVKATCSNEIVTKTHFETVQTWIGPVEIELSDCPLISGPLSAKLKRQGVNYSQAEIIQAVKKTRRTITMEF